MNSDTIELRGRFHELCKLQSEFWSGMAASQKDRIRQQHLAAAQSPVCKLRMLCDMADTLGKMRRALEQASSGDMHGS